MRLISAVTAILVACIPPAFALPTIHDTSNEVTEEGRPVRSLDETLAMTIDTLAVETNGSVSSSKKTQTFQVADEINDELTVSSTDVLTKKDKTTRTPKLIKGTKQPKFGTKMPKSSKCMIKMPKMPKGATIPPGESDYAYMRISMKGGDDCSEIQSFFEDNLCMVFKLLECRSVSASVENSSGLSRGLDAADVSFKSWSIIMQIFDTAAESLSKKEAKKIEKKLKKLWKKEKEIDIDTLLSIDDIFSIMIPSAQPSSGSSLPSSLPSFQPSNDPSNAPSYIPSDIPSDVPSAHPSSVPSSMPSDIPSDSPSAQPSSVSSSMPSDIPSDSPSDQPSSDPSSIPSDIPSNVPSDQPSSVPSSLPSDIPSNVPSDQPSSVPSSMPSNSQSPSDVPSDMPSQLDWTQLGVDIDGEEYKDFSGFSVSLSSDGRTVAIGAYLNDGVNGYYSGHVRVYEYDISTKKWNMLGDDIDGEDSDDFSGWSVSLSSDGKTVAIGAPGNDGVGYYSDKYYSGHVRVYEYDEANNKWNMLGNDIDGEDYYDESGYSVSLASDGKTVAIGASRNNGVNGRYSGHVRVYEYDEADNKWKMLGDDIDGEAIEDFSGASVSLSSDGRTVAIGAPGNDGVNGYYSGHVRVYEYDEPNDKWKMLGDDIDGEAAQDRAGVSVSLSSDGRTVAIGAQENDGVNDGVNGGNSGHVRVYEYDEPNDKWKMLGDDIDGEDEGDRSGISVSLSSDGKTVAIGAYLNDGVNGGNSGHVRVYEYDEPNDKWKMLGDDIDGEASDDISGRSVSLAADGRTVAVGAYRNDGVNGLDDSGHVRVYQLPSV